jgi:ABC-type glycerol-3-phosphate transport system permease component
MTAKNPWLMILFWLLLSFLTLFPIYWLFVISVKPAVELFSTPEVLLTKIYWQNYIDVLNDSTLRRYMMNSLSIFFWTITNRMAPPAVFLLPLYLLLTQVYKIGEFSLADTRTGMILVYCTFNLPFAIWTLRPTIDGIPKELDEAAYVDGASAWKVISEIVFPLARPGLAVTLILTWVFAWNEYLLAATLTNFNARTLTTGLSEYVTTTGTEWGIMAAISVFTLIPALIVFSLVQRHIVAGLTFGAVKG